MKKRSFAVLIIVILSVLVVASGSVFAGGGGAASDKDQRSTIAAIGENVTMRVEKALVVTESDLRIAIDWQQGATASIYPGQTIASGTLTIANMSPLDQSFRLIAETREEDPEAQPLFDVWSRIDGTILRPPWQLASYNLAAKSKVKIFVEVRVSYYSQTATFSGIDMVVYLIPPPTPFPTDGEKG